jgi:hypothetical protein
MEWSPEIVALGIHIRAIVEQELHPVDCYLVAPVYCFVQRSLISRVSNVNSATMFEQELRHLEIISV